MPSFLSHIYYINIAIITQFVIRNTINNYINHYIIVIIVTIYTNINMYIITCIHIFMLQ